MTSQTPAEPSALSAFLSMSKKDLAKSLDPALLEQASDEAWTVSMQLAQFAGELRKLQAKHGKGVLLHLVDDEPSRASAGASRPCAHRTESPTAANALTLCNSCDSRQADPSDPRGYCPECAAETHEAPEDEEGRRRDCASEWTR